MTPEQAREYWRTHEERFADIDWEHDPEGLAGYLGPGQPAWLNERSAALQRDIFDRLLAGVPPAAPDDRALDIGCGAGRWTRRLAGEGYRTVGIDLQERIIAANRERFPEIEWHAVPLQELHEERRFALIASVGVLEMIPYPEQGEVVRRIADVLAPGGRVILLAALSHPSANAYPHTTAGWSELFAAAGLRCEAQISYGWEPLRRSAAAAVRAIAPSRRLTPGLPTDAAPIDPARPGGAVYRAPAALRAVARVDDRLEGFLQRHKPPRLQSRWAGFRFCGS